MSESNNNEYSKVIFEDEVKGTQIRLVVSTFRDVEYLHVRKYYIDYEDTWHPTKDGVSFPTSIASIYSLLDGLIELCANSESSDSIKTHFKDLLAKLDAE